jgi:hypothetical protein
MAIFRFVLLPTADYEKQLDASQYYEIILSVMTSLHIPLFTPSSTELIMLDKQSILTAKNTSTLLGTGKLKWM